jgi:hypothetical protein
MANRAKYELYNPMPDENYPNFVRLNEKEDMDSITTEDGDLLYWLKDQAKKGVVSAQVLIIK